MDAPAPNWRLSCDLQREAGRAIQRALAQAWGEGLAGAALIERIDQACPLTEEPGLEAEREAWEWVRAETLRVLRLDGPAAPPVDFGLFDRSDDHAQDEANPRA